MFFFLNGQKICIPGHFAIVYIIFFFCKTESLFFILLRPNNNFVQYFPTVCYYAIFLYNNCHFVDMLSNIFLSVANTYVAAVGKP